MIINTLSTFIQNPLTTPEQRLDIISADNASISTEFAVVYSDIMHSNTGHLSFCNEAFEYVQLSPLYFAFTLSNEARTNQTRATPKFGLNPKKPEHLKNR